MGRFFEIKGVQRELAIVACEIDQSHPYVFDQEFDSGGPEAHDSVWLAAIDWCGEQMDDWRWQMSTHGSFICFRYQADAAAFKLRWG